MRDITSQAQLDSLLLDAAKETLEEMSQEIADELQRQIEEGIYGTASSENYSRTSDFIRAITAGMVHMESSGGQLEVYLDPSALTPVAGAEGEFGSHIGFDGSAFQEELISLYEKGGDAGVRGKQEQVGMVENTAKWFNKELAKMVRKVFRSHGFDIVTYYHTSGG